jgi:hypothetical protein
VGKLKDWVEASKQFNNHKMYVSVTRAIKGATRADKEEDLLT